MNIMEFPLVSFCIFSYQEEKFIAEAVDGALAQDYPNMEIIISDDCSTDKTINIIKSKTESYNGPHKIIINKNKHNLGIREHVNHILYDVAHGEFLVLAGGDDISRFDRVSRCVELMTQHPTVMSMSVRSQRIDENGTFLPMYSWESLSTGKYSVYTLSDYVNLDFMIFSGDSRVLRRRVIDSFPPLKYPTAEDIFLFVRSFICGDVLYLREPLVQYRQHSQSFMHISRNSKVDRNDQLKFEATCIAQFKEDIEYSLRKGYIKHTDLDMLTYKINQVIHFLYPKRRTFIWKCLNRSLKLLNKHIGIWMKRLNNEKLISFSEQSQIQ